MLLALAIDGFSQLELTYNSESNFIGAIIALMQKNTLKIVSKDLCDKECSVALR